MRRRPLSRLVGSIVAVLVPVSTSSLPLAHGYAHHRLHDERTHTLEHHSADPDSGGPEIEANHDSKDHAHPQGSSALSIRADLKVFVGPAPAPAWSAQIALNSSSSLLLTAAPARAGPADAPPRQPRAPPLG